jgi:siderophore synthetase component
MDTYAIAEHALAEGRWAHAGRRLLAKMLAEFLYEELLQAEHLPTHDDAYRVALSDGVVYSFRARRRLFDGWRVDPGSVRRHTQGGEAPAADPIRLLLDLRATAGITASTAAHLVKELSATLVADTHIAAAPARCATDLVDLPYHAIEGEMTGHPWIAPNKGRLGFSHADYLRYAPERRTPVRLRWLAARTTHASYQAVDGLAHERLLAGELDPATIQAFTATLTRRGLDPAGYLWFPVHDWQWQHVVIPLFAANLAAGDLVVLGEAPDAYLPQQSIRTLTNVTAPHRHHLKLPMSILNTLVWRGLPTERTVAAPKVTAFLHGIHAADPFLHADCRLVLLGEVASVAVPHPAYETLPGAPYQFRELLGCIWRESIHPKLDPGERAITMASLLHLDPHGTPVVTALVERSGLSATRWLAALFGAVLPPLLHVLYRYGTVFSPHGENAILVHRDGIPTRLAVKDFVDDVNITDQPLPELQAALPPDLRGVLLAEPPAWLCQFLWAGLFIGHLRYLADLVDDHLGVPERRFWTLVRDTVLAYHDRFPQLADRFRLFDLLAPRFAKICLNRNRLLLDGYTDRPERPHAATHGTVRNALHLVAETAGTPPAGTVARVR